MNSSKNCKTRK